jgi:TatA/E family protein of Tat protein translocase
MLVVFVIVLVVFGPQKLPELARSLGKMLAEFRKASADFRGAFEEEMRDLERQAREVERKKAADAATAKAAAEGPVQAATFATPAGVETSAFPENQDGWVGGAASLDTSGNAVDTRATEANAGLVVTPVTEAVPRGAIDGNGSATPLDNSEGDGASPSPASDGADAATSHPESGHNHGSAENAASAEVSGPGAPVILDLPHDQQPA